MGLYRVYKGGDKETKRKIIGLCSMGFCLVFCLGVLLTTVAFGWFSNNKNVNTGGAMVRAETTPVFIISQDKSQVTNTSVMPYLLYSTTFESAANTLLPCTRDTDGTYKAPDDLTKVTPQSGALGTASLAAATKDTHYLEYTVYLGVANKDLAYSNLTATLKNILPEGSRPGCYEAITIDFYVNGSFAASARYDDEYDNVVLLSNAGTVTPSDPITVRMIIYLDGAVTDNDGNAICRSATVDTTDLQIGVTFSANQPHDS